MAYKEGAKPEYLTAGKFKSRGVDLKGKIFPHGEERYSMSHGGDGVTLTLSNDKNLGWQSWHYHVDFEEAYTVLEGSIFVVELKDFPGRRTWNRVNRLKAYNTSQCVVPVRTIHNVYVCKNTKFLTYKLYEEEQEHRRLSPNQTDWFGIDVDPNMVELITDRIRPKLAD